jgi:prepilin-type processing-associated H-X9-DG protein
MKQLGLGFAQYTQDYDGRYPTVVFPLTSGDGGWVTGNKSVGYGLYDVAGDSYTNETADVVNGSLYTYVKSAQVYVCPSTEYGRQKGLSYSMNCILGNKLDAVVSEPSSIVLLVDEDKRLNDGLFSIKDGISSDGLTDVHLGGGNLLYCDGHVKFARLDSNPSLLGSYPTTRLTTVTGSPRFMDGAFDFASSSCPQS